MSLGVTALVCDFWMLNSDFWTRITSLHGYQPSPVVLCMQISVISIRITSLYGSQPVHVAFAFKPAPFGAELQVSISPRPHLSSCACKNSMICTRMTSLYGFQPLSVFFSSCKTVTLGPVLQVCMGPSPHVWFCACKSATLAHELLVSIGPSHHVWFLNAKQRLLDWNCKDLSVNDHTCCYFMQNFDFWTRITSLFGSQTWPVILCMYNSVLNIRITSLYGYQTSHVVFCKQNSVISTRNTSFYVFQPSSVVLCKQNSTLRTKIACLYGSQPSCVVVGC